MRVYAAADSAIGLDVDKDAFDKFRSAVPQNVGHIVKGLGLWF